MNGLYQTEGIILNSLDQGEADKVLTVFTKEFGMLRLFARGTRRASSKLNKFLNIFSYGRFGFVAGKDSWHLIDAEDFERFDAIFKPEFGRVSNFIERLCSDEGREVGMWEAFWNFIKSGDEMLFYAEALSALGYLDKEEIQKRSREELNKLISRAIAGSQL